MADLTFASLLAPSIEPVYAAIAAAVQDRVGLTAELVTGSYRRFRENAYDIAFICGLAYVEFERRGATDAVPVAAPVLQGDRFQGRPIYYSDVIVARHSPFRSFADLAGATWAFNEPLSQSGHGIVKHHLHSLGETDGFFGRIVQAGFHDRSIDLVARGSVDAAAIDAQVLAVAMRDRRSLADEIRIIDSLGPSTIQPVTVSPRLGAALQAEITAAITDLHLDPEHHAALDHGLVERFVAVDSADYDDIRKMRKVSGSIELARRP